MKEDEIVKALEEVIDSLEKTASNSGKCKSK